jgi:hypothetical protein
MTIEMMATSKIVRYRNDCPAILSAKEKCECGSVMRSQSLLSHHNVGKDKNEPFVREN